MLAYFAELIGSFFLGYAVLGGDILHIVITLASVAYFAGDISGGHFNPAVSYMMYCKGDMTLSEWLIYSSIQLTGMLLALHFHTYVQKTKN